MIKQLFFDLDGTLLNSRGHVSPANQAAIQKNFMRYFLGFSASTARNA